MNTYITSDTWGPSWLNTYTVATNNSTQIYTTPPGPLPEYEGQYTTPPAPEDDLAWLRRRVTEITEVIAA